MSKLSERLRMTGQIDDGSRAGAAILINSSEETFVQTILPPNLGRDDCGGVVSTTSPDGAVEVL